MAKGAEEPITRFYLFLGEAGGSRFFGGGSNVALGTSTSADSIGADSEKDLSDDTDCSASIAAVLVESVCVTPSLPLSGAVSGMLLPFDVDGGMVVSAGSVVSAAAFFITSGPFSVTLSESSMTYRLA